MIKRLVYIVFLLVLTPCLLLAKPNNSQSGHSVSLSLPIVHDIQIQIVADTIKSLKSSVKNEPKVKEVTKAKRQPRPEKVNDDGQATDQKEKPKRQRRPDGMERPPEIPRRNDN